MEGIITAWGKILRGYRPSLSIEITRECPLRCPGLLRLRRRASRRRRHAPAGHRLQRPGADRSRPRHRRRGEPDPRLDRRRRAAGPLPRAERDPAASWPTRGIYTQVVTSAVRPIPAEWAHDSAAADRRLDRRPAAGTRRAAHAGHLRPHPQAHRRAADHRALHDHAPAGAARRLPRGVRRASGRPTRTSARSGSASTRRRSARSSPEILTPHDRERVIAALMSLRRKLPEDRGCPRGWSSSTRRRRRAPTSASSRRRRPASRPTSSTASRRASSAAIRTARSAAASRRPDSRRSARTGCRAAVRVGAIFETSLKVGRAHAQPAGGGGLMAQAASFDITSTVDLQEVDNAVNQARKELAQRYDFKGSRAAIELNQKREHDRPDRRRRVQDDRAVGDPADAHGSPRRADQEPDTRDDRARRQRHGPARRSRCSRASRPRPPRTSSSS